MRFIYKYKVSQVAPYFLIGLWNGDEVQPELWLENAFKFSEFSVAVSPHYSDSSTHSWNLTPVGVMPCGHSKTAVKSWWLVTPVSTSTFRNENESLPRSWIFLALTNDNSDCLSNLWILFLSGQCFMAELNCWNDTVQRSTYWEYKEVHKVIHKVIH